MTLAENFEVIADKVYEKGQRDKLSEFTEMHQRSGTRVDYAYAYAWHNTDWIYPKYDIKPNSMAYMFYVVRGDRNEIVDLTERFKECGVVFDTSDSVGITWAFYNAMLDNIPPLDVQKCSSLHMAFSTPYVITYQKIILNSNGKTTHTNSFNNCTKLKHIRFEGAIGTTINFGDCPLDSLSILGDYATEEQIANGKNLYKFGDFYFYGGIMGALMDEPASGATVTFKRSVIDEYFDGEEGGMWLEIVNSKPNWNFAVKE